MRTALAAAVLLAAAPPARALQTNVGTATAQFLTVGAGARSLGLAGAYTSIAEGPDAIYWNPAGLATLTGPEVSYSLTQLPAGMTHDYAAAAVPVPWLLGDVGFAFTHLAQPGLDLVTASNQTVGSFAPHSESYAFAYAHRFELGDSDLSVEERDPVDREWKLVGADQPLAEETSRWMSGVVDIGLSAKAVDENLGTRSASTFAVDFGAMMRPPGLDDLSLGVAARDVGGKLRFIDQSEPLPAEVGLSAAYAIRGEGWRVLPVLDISLPYAGNAYGKFGVEGSRALGERAWASLRLGYTSQPVPDLGPLAGLTAGVGVRVNRFLFDAAFEPMSTLGDVYRLSAGWRF